MSSDKYIVNNRRQRDYLYTLGFDFMSRTDKFDRNKEVWVFDRTDLLLEAIDFYCKFRNKHKEER